MLTLEVKTFNLEAVLKAVENGPLSMRKAAARTLNDTLTHAGSIMAKQAGLAYKITQRDIRDSYRQHRASPDNLDAEIVSKGVKFPLFKFGVVAKRESRVVVQELRAGGPKPLNHAFMAIMESGHVGIFERVGKARLPIRELVALAAPQMIHAHRNWPLIDADLQAYLQRRMLANMNYFVNLAPQVP